MQQWPKATLYQGIESVAAEVPTHTAVVFNGERYTYEDLITQSRALAHGLADLGVGAGDIIVTWLSNRPEWIICQLASSYLGAANVAANTRYRTHELEYILSDSGASVLITEESFLGRDYHEMVAEIVPEVRVQEPDAFDPEGFEPLNAVVTLQSTEDVPALRDYKQVCRVGEDREDLDPADNATCPVAIFYTSGTTSDPKGCLQSNHSLLNHSYNVAEYLGVSEADVSVSMLPFCGIWGYNALFSVLTKGASIVTHTYFDPETTLRSIDKHDVTYVSGIAVMYQRMMETDAFSPSMVESVERGVAGFVSLGYDERLFERIEENFRFPPVQPYGLSEANSQIFVGDPDDPIERRKQVGGPLVHPSIETKIVDSETRERVKTGEQGELALRGYCVMNGYLGKPEKNDEAFDADGWFYTGDLCSKDEDDYHYYHSRLDDAIRTRGFLVSPREIESAINEHSDIDLSQVVGVPHPRHGEVPVAFVRLKNGNVDEDALTAFLGNHVADYKVPAAIRFVDSFPTTEGPNGEKIQKTELRSRVADLFEG